VRNLPERFAGAAQADESTGEIADWLKNLSPRLEGGIDPYYVGELVREGIENDWPYIFTDTEFEPVISQRFAGIKAGFDRVRGREPRR
jgi:hypothetical protein